MRGLPLEIGIRKFRMKNQLRLFGLLGCCLAFCGIFPDKAESKDARFNYPTKTGALWEYKIVFANKPPRYILRAVLTNLPQRTVKGLRVTPQRLVIQGGKPGTRIKGFLVAEDNSGVFGFVEDRSRVTGFSSSFYVVKNPIEVGTTWESDPRGVWLDESIGHLEKIVQTIESTSESITVRAGKFEQCVRVKAFVVVKAAGFKVKPGIESEMWFAPNVGLIKATYRHGQQESATVELQAYKL